MPVKSNGRYSGTVSSSRDGGTIQRVERVFNSTANGVHRNDSKFAGRRWKRKVSREDMEEGFIARRLMMN